MPKGYLVANIRVNDPEVFKKFSQTALSIIEQYGGKILARGPYADRHEDNVAGDMFYGHDNLCLVERALSKPFVQ